MMRLSLNSLEPRSEPGCQNGHSGELVPLGRTDRMQKCVKAKGSEVLTPKNEVTSVGDGHSKRIYKVELQL